MEIAPSEESVALFEGYQKRFSSSSQQTEAPVNPWKGLLLDTLTRHDMDMAAKLGAVPFKRLIRGGDKPGIFHALVMATGRGLNASDIVKQIGEERVLSLFPYVGLLKNKSEKAESPYTTAQALSLAIFHAAERESSEMLPAPFDKLRPVVVALSADELASRD
jgi:hypothetical protein